MINEYDCWLQKRKINIDFILPEILIKKIKGETAAQAVHELYSGIKRILGIKPKIKLISSVSFVRNKNGFNFKVTEKNIHITAADENGLLYGVFRFLALLSQNKIKPGFELSDSPASSFRIINHWDNLDGTVERGYAGKSLFFNDGDFHFEKQRIEDYARLLASTGINIIAINNVNVRAQAKLLIIEEYLKEAKELASIFRRFGIKLLLSVNFSSPISIGKLKTADPLDIHVREWWKKRAEIVYKYIPDLAGFLIKADSEGEPGPYQYGRNHAEGANMIADALKPFGGIVFWRCFVYNCRQDWRDTSIDRARAAFDRFMPQDGSFNENVVLQIKSGPVDFQVREPVHPLFYALKKTRNIMELQITQEYTGQQIDLCYLPSMWEETINIKNENKIEGFAAVANTGLDLNWTSHTLAQANLYGYGCMAWNPKITAHKIAEQWSTLSFGLENEASKKITNILLKSYSAYEKYTSPFGIGFMVTPGSHYGPNIEGYEYSKWGTYHRADKDGIGIDRTEKGTGFSSLYPENIASMYSNPALCPENLILFFHRLRYDFVMNNGKTLLQNIYDNHFEGYKEAESMMEDWKSLKPLLEEDVYKSVLNRFEKQLENAREWRDQINTYFFRKTGIADEKGRKIYI